MQNLDYTKKYALAVSGGVDSMVMLHKFATSLPRPDFFVVTVNHGIRAEAQADCNFVRQYCASIGAPCKVFSLDVPSYAQQNKLSVETAARILRYQIFSKLDCDFVCLAHHADDNAETVLMHILRGSGAQGACGMQRINGKYLRPLLGLSRAQIEQYAKQNNVPFVTDSTNVDERYTRNFIRQKVMPLLQQAYPTAQQSILRFAQNIGADNDFIDSLVCLDSVVVDGQTARVPLDLLRQPAPIASRLVYKVFAKLGVHYDIEKCHVDSILALAQGVGGKSVNLPFGYVAFNDYTAVTVCQKGDQFQADFCIPFSVGQTQTPLGKVVVSDQPLDGALRFCLDSIPADAVFRTRREGDVFTKFGGGQKSLKKYLIDSKIPQRKRQNLVLLASASQILAVVGVQISDKIKVPNGGKAYYIAIFGEGTHQ